MEQIDRVLNLASKGYRVFPLSPKSKIPLKGTHGVDEATTDETQIRKWDNNNSYSSPLNWGIAGGIIEGNDEEYLIVIDVDTKEGKNGASELDSLIEKYGPVPDTLKVRTASGGWHFYFRTTVKRTGYRSRFRGCEHIDVKCQGGYLVLWGCQTTTGSYTVESGHIDKLMLLEDWLGEDTENCITGVNKAYEREGIISMHDGRWSFLASWAGKLRADGLKDEALYLALLEKRMLYVATGPGDRIDENFVRGMADTFSKYPGSFLPTDQGNADRFLAAYGKEVKHAHQLGWHVWSGKNWQRDLGDKKVMHYAGQLIQVISNEMALSEDKSYLKILKASRQMLSMNNSRKNALALAKVPEEVSIEADDFDKSMFHLNVDNGILDLKTGDLLPHRPEMMMSKICPVEYREDEQAPKFRKFIDEITCGDTELAAWLQTYFGYSITASVNEQLFAVFYGTGGNGKSVLVNVISTIMGQYTLETPVETIMYKHGAQGGASNDVARIKGARLVTCRESDQGHSLAESLIKSLTGGDKITARFLHKEFFEFKPVAKWILFTNHKPSIKGTDKGIWRRVKLVPFKYSVPEDKKNKDLEPELLDEASGILNWLVEGCLMWQKNGFPKCAAIDEATTEYQQDEDRIGEFLNDAVIHENTGRVAASDLYKAYRWFCNDSGDMPLNSRNFPKKMEEKGFYKKRLTDGNFWLGITLNDEYIKILTNMENKVVSF